MNTTTKTTQTTESIVTVGSEWVHGNSFYPESEKIIALLAWDLVPAAHKKTWKTIEYWMTPEEFAARVYVMTVDPRGRRNVTPMDVFVGTRYVDHASMCEAYAAKRSTAKSEAVGKGAD